MNAVETQNAELIEQINSLQAAYGRMVDEHFEEKKELKAQLAKANERVAELERKEGRFDQYALESEVMRKALLNKDRNADDVSPRDLKDGLNKFAIEQKQAAINSIKDKWIKKASDMPLGLECRSKGSSCYNWAMYYAKELTDEAEKLRKEQGE